MISKRVYIAPNVFVAFIDRASPKHTHAAAFFRYFALEEYVLFTDTVSMVAAYNQIYERISPTLAKDFLRALDLGSINMLYPDESDIKAALKTLITYRSTDLALPEALMAVMANRNRIQSICTFEFLHSLYGLQAFFL